MKQRTPFAEDAAAVICAHCPMSLTCMLERAPELDAFYCKRCKGFSIPTLNVTVCCERFRDFYRMATRFSGGTMHTFTSPLFKGTVNECGACKGAWEHVRGIQ